MTILVELHEKRFDSLEKELGIRSGYLDTSNGDNGEATVGTNKGASSNTSLNTRKLDEEQRNLNVLMILITPTTIVLAVATSQVCNYTLFMGIS
ncbi:hypothetical protein FNV43_RR19707 [Rhamnella rubrinervis]|uniref:Uncharacterized protein n=1 Tax=Rhamnella rubrinervis TaxID=2594499 RepID=A0A8K0DZR5_9ROSA|nr:hypothetical protein FNV43_RR19707 [Rhamnella rubrinervis]